MGQFTAHDAALITPDLTCEDSAVRLQLMPFRSELAASCGQAKPLSANMLLHTMLLME